MSPQSIAFHEPAGIASLLTILVRNAVDNTADFGSFEGQLAGVKTFAAELKARTPNHNTDLFLLLADDIEKFFNESQTNKDLFQQAHLAIKALLEKMPTEGWGPCNYVRLKTIEEILKIAP